MFVCKGDDGNRRILGLLLHRYRSRMG